MGEVFRPLFAIVWRLLRPAVPAIAVFIVGMVVSIVCLIFVSPLIGVLAMAITIIITCIVTMCITNRFLAGPANLLFGEDEPSRPDPRVVDSTIVDDPERKSENGGGQTDITRR
jgi:hypothetical protein